MADYDKYNIFWNTFRINMKTSWKKLQMEKDFCDVTLACEGKQFQTHKLVLISCSPILKSILKTNKNMNVVIYLRGVNPQNLKNLLTLMYQGVVDVTEKDLASFLEIVEDLNIEGLSIGNLDNNSREDEPLEFSQQQISEEEDLTQFSQKQVSEEDDPIKFNEQQISKEEDPVQFCLKEVYEEDYPVKFNQQQISKEEELEDPVQFNQKQVSQYLNRITTSENIDDTFVGSFNKVENQHETISSSDSDTIGDTLPIVKRENQIETIDDKGILAINGHQFICGICEKPFATYAGLKNHKKSAHMGVRYSCKKCDYKATQKGNLDKHVASIHDGIRYPCSQCDYQATVTGSLKRHIGRAH